MGEFKLNTLLFHMGLSWEALGIISTLVSYGKKNYSFAEIRSYSYVNSSYQIKKYLKELVSKDILLFDAKSKRYIIYEKYLFSALSDKALLLS